MQVELSIIKYLLNPENFTNYSPFLKPQDFPDELRIVFTSLCALHAGRLADDAIPVVHDLANVVFSNHPKDKEFYQKCFEHLESYQPLESSVLSLIDSLKQKRLLQELALAAYEAGEGKKPVEDVHSIYTKLSTKQQEEEIEFVSDDLEELLNETYKKPGLKWRLPCLNKSLGSLRKGDFGFIFARPECLAPETPVLLYSGKVIQAQEVIPGMCLMGDDSTPRQVISTSYGTQPMYRITYPWGESYTVNENHILSLKRSKIEASHNYGDILNVTVKEYLDWPESRKQRYKGWKTGVTFSEQVWHKLDPYFLGLWLGDGTSANQNITNADKEVIDWLQGYSNALGLTFKKTYRESQGKAYTVSFINSKGKPNKLLDLLREYKLINNKHIPFEFKTSSVDCRKKILAGLIDTDGYYDAVHNGYEIATISGTLADDILFLARSLGLHATKQTRTTHYRINIYGDLSSYPIQINRKKYKAKKTTKRKGLQFGFIIEPIGEGQYYGFTLTGNHLFVLGDFTVTHNTGKTTFLASEVSNFLTQTEKNIIWFNNEEQGSKVMLRVYQAYFGVTLTQLYGNLKHYRDLFKEQTKGRLKLYDSSQINKATVESLSKKFTPGLIIFDQIDKLQGFKAERDDLLLGSIYQWARCLAKEYCPVLGITQADGGAEGVRWLTMAHVANAKTAKQAEADFILGIGSTNDSGWEHIRFFNISKNKLLGDENTRDDLRHGKFEVILHPEIARYDSIPGREY